MKRSSIRKFGKVVIVDTVAKFQKWSVEFALNERSLIRAETNMNAEIDKIKLKYEADIAYHTDARNKIAVELTKWASAFWDRSATQQVFDYIHVFWSIPRGSLKLQDEEKTIASLKTMGLTDLVRTQETVKKEEFKARFAKESAIMASLGAEIVKGDPTADVEVNWSHVGSSFEMEQEQKRTA